MRRRRSRCRSSTSRTTAGRRRCARSSSRRGAIAPPAPRDHHPHPRRRRATPLDAMSIGFWTLLIAIALIGWLVGVHALAEAVTNAQQLIQQRRYEERSSKPPARTIPPPRRGAQAPRQIRRRDRVVPAVERSRRARRHRALARAPRPRSRRSAAADGRDRSRSIRRSRSSRPSASPTSCCARGDREGALRLYRDNLELLETRFRDDYTDPDPLLAETLFLFAALAEANGERKREAGLAAASGEAGLGSPESTTLARELGETRRGSAASRSARRRDARDSSAGPRSRRRHRPRRTCR